jgi:hypothetical protein
MRCSRRIPSETPVSSRHISRAAAGSIALHRLGRISGNVDVLLGGPDDVHRNGHADNRYGEADDDEEHARFIHKVPRSEWLRPVNDQEVKGSPDEAEGLDRRPQQSND